MATKFLIQSTEMQGKEVPAQDFGYTTMQIANYYNWLCPSNCMYDFEYVCSPTLFGQKPEWTHIDENGFSSCIPIGSVEFTLEWFKAMGIENVKPLNIPQELWKFCDRLVTVDYCVNVRGHLMKKDTDKIKDICNGETYIHENQIYTRYFFSEWVDNIVSEWRVFVFNGEIQDIRCYLGDPWVIPDKHYVEEVVDVYSKIRNTAYTLDVLVTDKKTEILELHDFFSCGLYGFEDFRVLPLMYRRAISFILMEQKGK